MSQEQAYSGSAISVRISRAKARVSIWARSLIALESSSGINVGSSATISTQIWLSQFPWRPTAGWAAITALLAVGYQSRLLDLDWREIALLLLLVDPLWGSIWRLAGGRTELLPLQERDVQHQLWLPYLQPGSPAALFLGKDDRGVLHLLYRVGLPTILLALAIAFVLGPAAAVMTGVVIAVCVVGWIGRHAFGTLPASLHSLVTIALPWGLTLNQMGLTQGSEHWLTQMTLLGLWFLHNWGEGRTTRSTGDWLGIALLGAADLGIGILLLVSRAPLWLAPIAVLLLPTWFTIYQGRSMQRLNFWWLVAMLISGIALGQSL